MTTKHEPQPWDMYRTHTGSVYIITMLYDSCATPCVEYIDTDGNKESLTVEQCQQNEFLGNVLALPELLEVIEEAVRDLHYLANGGDPSVKWAHMEDALCTICGDLEEALTKAGCHL